MGRYLMRVLGAFLIGLTAVTCSVAGTLDLDRLSAGDIARVKAMIAHLEPFMRERERAESLATLTFVDLYGQLSADEKKFLRAFQDLDGKTLGVKIPYRGMATGQEDLVAVRGQAVRVHGREALQALPVQFVPPPVYKKYTAMMAAMDRDLGKRLYIESAYRSSAYQLYLFVYYLQNHAYSIRETARFVALPGFSEHGWPAHQALDFISEQGISGEYRPEEFSRLPEYAWLLKNARRFGFVLSYPKNSPGGITFEPWHWRWGG